MVTVKYYIIAMGVGGWLVMNGVHRDPILAAI